MIRYTCSYSDCGLQFKRKDQLDSHEYTHSKCKKFKCTEINCDKAYVNNAHLKRHIRSFHRNPHTIIPCKFSSECTILFSTEATMLRHCEKIHGEPQLNKFKCDLCSESFRRKAQHRLHMFSHTKNYPYKCKSCDKGFVHLYYLKRHERSHKLHSCDQCDAVYPKWSQLVAHKHSVHTVTENKCSICNRIFHSKHGLKYHQRIHTQKDDRIVYQCNFDKCPKYFFHRQNLTAHYKSKHENRKFVCTVDGCARELCTKQKLELHIKIFHASSKKVNEMKKIPKTRAQRKDKGMTKTSTASKLFNIIAPLDVEKAILAGQGNRIYFHYDNEDKNDMDSKITERDDLIVSVSANIEVQC